MQPESRLEENSTAELTRAIAICHSRHLISDEFMPRRHNVQLVEPHPEACLSPPRGRPFVPRCTASSGRPGSGWSSAFRARPVRANHADLPRRLHATHPDSIRSLRSLHRDGDCLSFFALGRDNRSLRRGRRQRSRLDQPESGTVCLSDVRPKPSAAFRRAGRAATPCPALAIGGTPQASWQCRPCPRLAWAPGGRNRNRSDCAQALRRRFRRTGRRACATSGMDG